LGAFFLVFTSSLGNTSLAGLTFGPGIVSSPSSSASSSPFLAFSFDFLGVRGLFVKLLVPTIGSSSSSSSSSSSDVINLPLFCKILPSPPLIIDGISRILAFS